MAAQLNFNLIFKQSATDLKVTPICSDYITNCTWNGEDYECIELFKIASTDDGYCCTFNSIPAKANLADIG